MNIANSTILQHLALEYNKLISNAELCLLQNEIKDASVEDDTFFYESDSDDELDDELE